MNFSLLIIAIIFLIALLYIIPSNENFVGFDFPYYTNDNNNNFNLLNSVDCNKFPDAPACKLYLILILLLKL